MGSDTGLAIGADRSEQWSSYNTHQGCYKTIHMAFFL